MSDNNTISEQSLKDQVALVSFVEDLIKERKDPNITDANVNQVKAMLLREVNDSINAHLINLLSGDDQKALDSLLDTSPADDAINAFLTQKIPNLEIEIAAALLSFKEAYLLPVVKSLSIPENHLPEIKPDISPSMPPPLMPAPIDKKPGEL